MLTRREMFTLVVGSPALLLTKGEQVTSLPPAPQTVVVAIDGRQVAEAILREFPAMVKRSGL